MPVTGPVKFSIHCSNSRKELIMHQMSTFKGHTEYSLLLSMGSLSLTLFSRGDDLHFATIATHGPTSDHLVIINFMTFLSASAFCKRSVWMSHLYYLCLTVSSHEMKVQRHAVNPNLQSKLWKTFYRYSYTFCHF